MSNVEAVKSSIRSAVIDSKANACPMTVRLAWHASGTFDRRDASGGSDGAHMRFAPESTDDANKGLSIIQVRRESGCFFFFFFFFSPFFQLVPLGYAQACEGKAS